MEKLDLTGKNILITGGTRGIGRATSRLLAEHGARVGAIFRNDSKTAGRTLEQMQWLHKAGDHFILQADISNEFQAKEAVIKAGKYFNGVLDALILNAAVGASGPMVSMKTEDWKRPFEVNVHSALYMVRAAVPIMKPGSSIVFVSSGAGHDPIEGLSAYGASKAAINHISTVLAQELGPKGIRVNVVSPGHTYKEEENPNERPDNLTNQQMEIIKSTALRRIGVAIDVANVILFFVSDLSSFVTGQWLRVNGGRL